MNAIGFKYKPSEKARSIGGGQEVCACLSSETHDAAVAFCYDGYNQQTHEEVCMTIRRACSGGERNDATPKVAIGFKAGQSKDGGLGDEREVSPTLSHKPSALEPTVAQSNIAQMRYIVRRLTPTECERLMGLPDGYTIPTGLRHFFDANGEPSPELVAEFQRIHDTFGAIMAEYEHAKPPKPKTAAQVQKWLAKIADPATCPDSPRYKGCGNGWATNQPRWILTRLLYFTEQENTQTTQTTKEKENT